MHEDRFATGLNIALCDHLLVHTGIWQNLELLMQGRLVVRTSTLRVCFTYYFQTQGLHLVDHMQTSKNRRLHVIS
jgi:hypothetical protein